MHREVIGESALERRLQGVVVGACARGIFCDRRVPLIGPDQIRVVAGVDSRVKVGARRAHEIGSVHVDPDLTVGHVGTDVAGGHQRLTEDLPLNGQAPSSAV